MQILIDNHMLTADEEAKLRSSLKFQEDDRWLALLYQSVPPPHALITCGCMLI